MKDFLPAFGGQKNNTNMQPKSDWRGKMKIRFIEPGNLPYKKSIKNYFVYDGSIRTPSNGMITLATILKTVYEDVYCYSESISEILWQDVLDADIIFISIFTFNANRGYELAEYIRKNSSALLPSAGFTQPLTTPKPQNTATMFFVARATSLFLNSLSL